VILGTESTGKSTLTEKLAQHFNCSMVTEAGRDIIDDSNDFLFDDLYSVAIEHAARIDKAVKGNHLLIIIDTDIHITKSYANFMFHQELEVNKKILDSNKAQLYLYLNNDVAYFQDGTRLSEDERNLLDLSHRKVLQNEQVSFVEITGHWEARFSTAIVHINQLIDQMQKS
jgi:HTH-type transcriptional regulator, transcriptional repressor of NAD biosynthesis genes